MNVLAAHAFNNCSEYCRLYFTLAHYWREAFKLTVSHSQRVASKLLIFILTCSSLLWAITRMNCFFFSVIDHKFQNIHVAALEFIIWIDHTCRLPNASSSPTHTAKSSIILKTCSAVISSSHFYSVFVSILSDFQWPSTLTSPCSWFLSFGLHLLHGNLSEFPSFVSIYAQ